MRPHTVTQRGFNITPWQTAIATFGLYAVWLIVACLPSFSTMVQTWLTSTYNHGFAVAPFSLFLIWSMRKRRAAITPRPWITALWGVGVSTILWLAGRYIDAQLVEHVAIVSLLISGAAFIFGKQLAGLWHFPLLFLYFMVPFGEVLTPMLRIMTAFVTTGLLNLSGFTAALDGLIITTSGGRFHIAEACSGLRFLLASTIISSVFAYYTFSSWRKFLLFFSAAIAIALTANILRVSIVIGMATLAGDASTVVEDHMLLGWVFYATALMVVIMLGLKLSAGESRAI